MTENEDTRRSTIERVELGRINALWVYRCAFHSVDQILADGYFDVYRDRGFRNGDELRIVAGSTDAALCEYASAIFCEVPREATRPITTALLTRAKPVRHDGGAIPEAA